jgi:cytosine/adenosine deaminase-related metal-dependent hydrolase
VIQDGNLIAIPCQYRLQKAVERENGILLVCGDVVGADNAESWSLTAQFIFPVDGPPLENGIVVVEGALIKAIEPAGARKPDLNLGGCVVIPGLVNAHTHLDLSGLRGKIPKAANFTDWLKAVIHHRRGLSPAEIQEAIQGGLKESLFTGTTLLGDISGMGLSWVALSAATLRATVFYELLGLPGHRSEQAWIGARTWLASHPASPKCRPGLSPHAPYSVRASLFDLAAHSHVPLSIHLAETREEIELLERHTGSFHGFLEELDVWDPEGLIPSISKLLEMTQDTTNVLLIHGNYLELSLNFPAGSTVIYCPRTHAYFGHSLHPFRDLLTRGVRVALGTDSLASNPDLDVLAELRFLGRQFPDVPGSTLLRMATLNGAEALGWQDETGNLRPGKSADLAVVPLPDRNQSDPYRLLIEGSAPVRAVLFRGRWVYDSSEAIALGENTQGMPFTP